MSVRDVVPGAILAEQTEVLSFLCEYEGLARYLAKRPRQSGHVLAHMVRAKGPAAGGPDLALVALENAAQLQHAAIPERIAVGRYNDEVVYLLEAYPLGDLLEDLLSERKGQAPSLVLRRFQQMVRAVHAAHERGLHHGLLTPASILIERSGAADEGLYVLGLGVTQAISPPPPAPPQWSYQGPGAPGGDAFQADLRALGVLLLAMSAGIEAVRQLHTSHRLPQALADGPLGSLMTRALGLEKQGPFANSAALLAEIDQLAHLLDGPTAPGNPDATDESFGASLSAVVGGGAQGFSSDTSLGDVSDDWLALLDQPNVSPGHLGPMRDLAVELSVTASSPSGDPESTRVSGPPPGMPPQERAADLSAGSTPAAQATKKKKRRKSRDKGGKGTKPLGFQSPSGEAGESLGSDDEWELSDETLNTGEQTLDKIEVDSATLTPPAAEPEPLPVNEGADEEESTRIGPPPVALHRQDLDEEEADDGEEKTQRRHVDDIKRLEPFPDLDALADSDDVDAPAEEAALEEEPADDATAAPGDDKAGASAFGAAFAAAETAAQEEGPTTTGLDDEALGWFPTRDPSPTEAVVCTSHTLLPGVYYSLDDPRAFPPEEELPPEDDAAVAGAAAATPRVRRANLQQWLYLLGIVALVVFIALALLVVHKSATKAPEPAVTAAHRAEPATPATPQPEDDAAGTAVAAPQDLPPQIADPSPDHLEPGPSVAPLQVAVAATGAEVGAEASAVTGVAMATRADPSPTEAPTPAPATPDARGSAPQDATTAAATEDEVPATKPVDGATPQRDSGDERRGTKDRSGERVKKSTKDKGDGSAADAPPSDLLNFNID